MFLLYKLLHLGLKRNGWWIDYLRYCKAVRQTSNHSFRIDFLENCLKENLILQFLKFRIPANGCFDDKTVLEFQRKEVYKAKGDRNAANEKLEIIRNVR